MWETTFPYFIKVPKITNSVIKITKNNILEMKAHFEKEPHFGNESSFQNPF